MQPDHAKVLGLLVHDDVMTTVWPVVGLRLLAVSVHAGVCGTETPPQLTLMLDGELVPAELLAETV